MKLFEKFFSKKDSAYAQWRNHVESVALDLQPFKVKLAEVNAYAHGDNHVRALLVNAITATPASNEAITTFVRFITDQEAFVQVTRILQADYNTKKIERLKAGAPLFDAAIDSAAAVIDKEVQLLRDAAQEKTFLLGVSFLNQIAIQELEEKAQTLRDQKSAFRHEVDGYHATNTLTALTVASRITGSDFCLPSGF